MEKKISVIIPVYNTEAYLEQCLKSVINQTYRNLEIICVNDGSTDGSLQLLKKYLQLDQRIVIINQINKGLSEARNIGLINATGDYVMYVDSDDWIDVDICRRTIDAIQKYDAQLAFWSYTREFRDKSKTKEVIGTQEVYYDEEGVKKLHRQLVGLVGEELARPDKGDSLVTAWGKLYKRELISDIRFVDTKIIGTEDALFNIYAFSQLGSAVYLPVYSYHYRKYNQDSLTTVYNPWLFKRWQRMYSLIEEYIKKEKMPEVYYSALSNRRALGLIALSLNIVASKQGIAKKIKELDKIIESDPYQKAFALLPFKVLPLPWKLFFGFAKCRLSSGVFLLAYIMQRLRGK